MHSFLHLGIFLIALDMVGFAYDLPHFGKFILHFVESPLPCKDKLSKII